MSTLIYKNNINIPNIRSSWSIFHASLISYLTDDFARLKHLGFPLFPVIIYKSVSINVVISRCQYLKQGAIWLKALDRGICALWILGSYFYVDLWFISRGDLCFKVFSYYLLSFLRLLPVGKRELAFVLFVHLSVIRVCGCSFSLPLKLQFGCS